MSVIAVFVSLFLLLGGKIWSLWMAGFIYLAWAVYGYVVEYMKKIPWRNPIRWSLFVPYVFLYLVTIMFYWWPLGIVSRPLWYAYAVLFVISIILNITSHRSIKDISQLG